MTLDKAKEALGLSGAFTESDVRGAYAAAVKRAHPDTAGDDILTISIKDLQAARDLLLDSVASQNSACTLCKGKGMVRGAMGLRECTACKGTGDRR